MVNKILHSSSIQTEINDKKKMTTNIFRANFLPLLKDINHPALFQGWKLNLDAAEFERNIDAKCINILIKGKIIVMIATCTGQP